MVEHSEWRGTFFPLLWDVNIITVFMYFGSLKGAIWISKVSCILKGQKNKKLAIHKMLV